MAEPSLWKSIYPLVESFAELVNLIGKPYSWCQLIAGLEFISSSRDRFQVSPRVSQSSMERTLRAIERRIKTRLLLHDQIACFSKGMIGTFVPTHVRAKVEFPAKIRCAMHGWSEATVDDIRQSELFAEFEDQFDGDWMAFQFSLVRSIAKLRAVVMVPPNYPDQMSFLVFSLKLDGEEKCSKNSALVRSMEAECNVRCLEKVEPIEYALSVQLRHAAACFDVSVDCGQLSVGETAKDAVYTRVTRGRDRCHPYKFVASLGLFTHPSS